MKNGYQTILLFFFLITPSLTYAQTFFTANLTPSGETGEVTSEGSGTAAFVLTPEGLRYFVTVNDLTGDIMNAHFHAAATGVDGGVVRGIFSDFSGNTASGIWTASDSEPLTDALIDSLFAGNLYLNIHTAQYPAGEIRGQVLPASGTGMEAILTPEQGGSDIESEGRGVASMLLTDAGLLYMVTVSDLTGPISNAHFHSGEVGVSGGVVHGIMGDFEGNTALGIWTPEETQPLTDELREDLVLGELYLNVHTAQYPAGEIRGQVMPAGGWGFTASLDPSQETEEVTSDGTGTGTFTLTEEGLIFNVTASGLTGDIANAHFHLGEPGVAGPVVHGIMDDFEGNTASGIWRRDDDQPLTDELIRELFAGNLYVNIHTAQYPGGEIRGQVITDPGTNFKAVLTPQAEPGGASGDGSGTAFFSLTEEGLAFRVTIDSLTSDLANAHFHQAQTGVNGGVVRGILAEFDGNTASGTWSPNDDEPLTPDLITELLLGNLYLNVHTPENPGGEIRGQIHLSEGTALRSFLTNEQSSGDITQEGSGTASLLLTDAGVVFNLTVDSLSGPIANAHFHSGEVGVDGGVVRGIMDEFTGNSASGVWAPDDAQALDTEMIRALLTGDLYLNVHTSANPGGEIRGQVYPNGGFGSAVQLDTVQASGTAPSSGTGASALLLTPAGLIYSLSVADLTGPITNAHFHQAAFGESGGVVRGIFDEFSGSTAEGVWLPRDDQSLTPDLLDALLAGDIYLNVHTQANPGGEIRGQIYPRGVTVTAIDRSSGDIPEAFVLEQNYPNPFNPETTIQFSIPTSTRAVLTIFNSLGQQVATVVDELLSAGEYRVSFDARNLPSGLYYYRLQANNHSEIRSMVLVR